jgi:hypothetical protein
MLGAPAQHLCGLLVVAHLAQHVREVLVTPAEHAVDAGRLRLAPRQWCEGKEFDVSLDELHNDSTTVTFCGAYTSATAEQR